MTPLLPRAYLFAPGHRPTLFGKAAASGADLAILDLEDAVAEDAKATARDAIATWLTPETPVAIRINHPRTPWAADDAAICHGPAVAAVVIPKVDSVDEIIWVADRIPGAIPFLPMIESARGLHHALAVAQHPRVQRLVFGTLDFQLDLGMSGDDALLYFRSHLVFLSRVAGIGAPVDGVTPAFDVPESVLADTARARRLGFGGKLCIHPKQIGWVHTAFASTPEEREWAARVMAASDASGGAATSVDGAMIDRPVIERARGILMR